MKFGSAKRVVALAAAALLSAGVLTACSSGGGDDGGSKTLNVTLANHVWTDVITKKIKEFEEDSGLTVEINQLSEDQLVDNYKVKLNAGSSDVDVMMYRPLQVGKLFGQSGYFADITDRVNDAGDWNWDDFQAGPVGLTTYEDMVVGVPMITENEMLYYRKDLLEKSGLEVPKTMDDLMNAAKTIKEDNDGVAGIVMRSQASAAVTQFSGFLYSFGGTWEDDSGNSAIGSDEAKEAYAFYGKLLHDYGPDQISTDMSWPEAAAIFAQGDAGFWIDASSLYENVYDPEKSKVGDQVGFAPFPEGPAGSKPYNVAAWALGINAASQNQDNAWKFIKWATSPEMTLEIQKEGVPSARTSVWENPEGTSNFPEELAKAIQVNGENGVGNDRPLVIGVAEAREIVGAPIVEAITGGDSDAAADEANQKFQDLLDSEK
ncbi:ABC transporter substrate-binding protein [Paramicrobacterium agarici]|uniref:Carbohydrate ABC transporter substrate-binding protein (CUT1 family) n=1 Tax=Paramicrobacterium agarici TaxID=630514 RepID=A0A2A9DSJ5_9MICO|nr:sugar ABC transporter substrate-binding protein [Microbacterium agarici]PFG29341.1 carbohydrate ABC transporter substrate-binding protein (CUT1 family) [Microbacterium agarici]